MTRICFVCLGNICRSPTAEGVFGQLVAEAGLEDSIQVESAGTGDWHVGEPPDPRAVAAASGRGIVLDGRARCFAAGDFDRFDLVVAMDRANRDALLALAPTDEAAGKVVLLRSFAPDGSADAEVPDPYFGGDDGFGEVLDVIEASSRGLLEHVRASIGA
jgi:protein-tyrosine phosphatase